ncbi:hypothetical protein C0J45_23352, partial [Silurus meridionalis]
MFIFMFSFIYILFFTAGSLADKIGRMDEDANTVGKELNTVTLECSYETSSDRIWLYWHKQYPHSRPQFVLLKDAKRVISEEYNKSGSRFKAETTSNSTKLTINNLQLSDSA